MYVARVASNVKLGEFSVHLRPKTIIVGPTGSGKTSITDAMALALTGTVDDVGGKSASQEIELMKLKPADAEGLYAAVAIADEAGKEVDNATWRSDGSSEKAKRARHSAPPFIGDDCLPLRHIADTIGRGQDKLRAEFVSALANLVKEDEIITRLVSDEAKDAFLSQPKGNKALTNLEHALIHAGERKRDTAAVARTLTAQAPTVGHVPTLAEIAKAEREAAAAAAKRDAALIKFGATVAEAGKDGKPSRGIPPVLIALAKLLLVVVDNPRSDCPACGQKVKQGVFADRLAAVDAKIDRLAKRTVIGLDEPEERERGGDPRPQALREADEASFHAHRNLADLRQARAEFDAYEQNRTQALKAKRDADVWKSVEEELRKVRDDLLTGGAVKLESAINAFLPPAFQLKIVLGVGDRRVCYFGIPNGNEVRTALSAGETAMALTAMACAMSKSKLCVVIPPDCSMSPNVLSWWMAALTRARAQVIITTTTMPSEVPAGWTLIQTPLRSA